MVVHRYGWGGPPGGSEIWECPPPFRKWALGIGAALLVAAYAARVLIRRQARVGVSRGFHGGLRLEGWSAVLWGIAVLGLALFLHFRCFWGEVQDDGKPTIYGQWVSAAMVVVGFVGTFSIVIWGIIR